MTFDIVFSTNKYMKTALWYQDQIDVTTDGWVRGYRTLYPKPIKVLNEVYRWAPCARGPERVDNDDNSYRW